MLETILKAYLQHLEGSSCSAFWFYEGRLSLMCADFNWILVKDELLEHQSMRVESENAHHIRDAVCSLIRWTGSSVKESARRKRMKTYISRTLSNQKKFVRMQTFSRLRRKLSTMRLL